MNTDQELLARIHRLTGMSVSAIAGAAGIAPSTLLRVSRGESRFSSATIDRLRERFGRMFTPPDKDNDSDVDRLSYVEVEILPTYAGAGGGGTGDGPAGIALLPRKLIEERLRGNARDFIMIEIRGDSMIPDFHQDDQILVDRRDRDPSQPGPFALWDGDAYVVKLVERQPQRRGWLRIFSANDRYTPYEALEEEVRIIGRPVWFGRSI